MKVALFASGAVGAAIAKFLGEVHPPAVLLLDSHGPTERNEEILRLASGAGAHCVFYSESLGTESTLSTLDKLELDLFVLAWWPSILKRELLAIPRMGCLNLHPSYLPYNRGKHYNFWTIVEDTPFGVTIHWVDEGVDSGDIAFQARIEKGWEDTGETLYCKAQSAIIDLFKSNFSRILEGDIPRIAQPPASGSFHRASELHLASRLQLDDSYSAREMLNLLRARTFPPHPAAWFTEGDRTYEVRVDIEEISGGGSSAIR